MDNNISGLLRNDSDHLPVFAMYCITVNIAKITMIKKYKTDESERRRPWKYSKRIWNTVYKEKDVV